MVKHYSTGAVTDHGTPAITYDNATSPESRTDIPPVHRIGMPMYRADLYEKPADDDPNIVDGEVVEPKHALDAGDDDSGAVVATKGGK